jgi:hypothetical protein
MNNKDIIFNEIFSSYYKVMREITNVEPMDIKELQNFISSRSSDESSLFLLNNLNNYFFLKEINGKWQSKLSKKIVQPLTELEKSWLKAIISDPIIKLFVDEEKINHLDRLLGNDQPLFDKSVFHYFDQTTSSDEFLSEEYINKFKTIKKAIEEKKNIVLDYTNIRNENYVEESVPLKLEYSLKNNKFRLLAVRFRKGKKELKAYNVKQINKIIEIKDNTFENINRDPYADEYCEEPVKILIHNTRGAIMRFMTEFSTYKKESLFDDETGECTTTFYYHSEEKPEIINKILSFGVAVKVLSPSNLIEEIKARIKKQIELLDKMAVNNPVLDI